MAAMNDREGKSEMDIDEEIRFVCPNFAKDYTPGVMKLPKEFCLEHGDSIPERLLLHVPPGVVWNGLYSKDRFCNEGLEKMMSFYSIKPYHLVLFDYHGGPSFNLKIFNPYGVEISYDVSNRSNSGIDSSASMLSSSELEVEKLCGTLAFNAYQSGQTVCDVVVRKRHLRKSVSYEILQKDDWERLGLVESMDFVKLTYKNVTWVVKLKWENGILNLGRMWYVFAKAGKMQKGDIIAFRKTEKAHKYMVCIFERDLRSKCNHAGLGQKSGIMDWLKIANFEFISTGEMEIPRVFIDSPGVSLPEKVNLILRDGETVVVKYSTERKMLYGMRKLIHQYSIKATDVMIFTFINDCSFVLSLFKFSGIESKYIVQGSDGAEDVNKKTGEAIIIVSDDSDEDMEEVALADDPDVADNAEVDAAEAVAEPISFRVTLRASHVDKRQHGVYLSPSIYSTYKSWNGLTNIRLIFGARISFVSILRSGKVCRFGKGWSEFTVANELAEGQVLQLDYIDELTFQVQVV